MAPRIVTITLNPAIDVSVTVDRIVPDHKMRAVDDSREPGGGGINAARVLHRLGDDVLCFVAVGGPLGVELLEMLRARGIPARSHAIPGATRESIAIRSLETGEQFKVGVAGPVVTDPDGLRRSIMSCLEDADAVVVSGRYLPGLEDGFAADVLAAVPNKITVVDAVGASLRRVLAGRATVAKPSARELGEVVARPLHTLREVERAAREALSWGQVGALVVSLGATGAVLVEANGPSTLFTPPPVGPVVSTVGAGDSMVAGIVHRLARGHTMLNAATFGVAAGTAAVLTPGSALCDVDVARELETSVTRQAMKNASKQRLSAAIS